MHENCVKDANAKDAADDGWGAGDGGECSVMRKVERKEFLAFGRDSMHAFGLNAEFKTARGTAQTIVVAPHDRCAQRTAARRILSYGEKVWLIHSTSNKCCCCCCCCCCFADTP